MIDRESSSFTRLRNAAALGLMPPIPDAATNSRSTASPFEQKALKGKGLKKSKRRRRKSGKKKVTRNPAMDSFLVSAEALRKDLDNLSKKMKGERNGR